MKTMMTKKQTTKKMKIMKIKEEENKRKNNAKVAREFAFMGLFLHISLRGLTTLILIKKGPTLPTILPLYPEDS